MFVFFDEVNTNRRCIGIFEEMLRDGVYFGKSLERVDMIAALNPYRERPKSVGQSGRGGGGIQLSLSQHRKLAGDNTNELVYRVYPMSFQIKARTWRFQSVSNEEEEIVVQELVSQLLHDTSSAIDHPQRVILFTKMVCCCQQF